MRDVGRTGRFKSDFKKVKHGDFDHERFKYAVECLAKGKPLPEDYRDHPLRGNLKDYRECHIMPDMLLIYKIDSEYQRVILTRIGNHSNLFE